MRRIEVIGEINIVKMKDEEIKEVLEIINSGNENKWIRKINERFQELKGARTINEKRLNEIREREERIQIEESKSETLIGNKNQLFKEFKEERKRKIKWFKQRTTINRIK